MAWATMPKHRKLMTSAETEILLPQTRHGLIVKRPTNSAPARRRTSAAKPWAETRAGKMARAKKLLRDPNYPTPAILQSVANLLASKLDRPAD